MINHATYGYFNDKFFKVDDCNYIVIPQGSDYTSNAINSQIVSERKEAEIDIYKYHSDFIITDNGERVASFKEYLIEEKIKEVIKSNSDYCIGISYEIYNKDNNMIKGGEQIIKAKYLSAVIAEDITPENKFEYRKGFVFDARIEIPIPDIGRYGIKNNYTQNPYTVRVTKIAVYTTVGDFTLIKEKDTQIGYDSRCSYANYHCQHSDLLHNNFASNFLTNAKVGTTMIDQLVVPRVLNTVPEFDTITVCEIECNNDSIVRLDAKLNKVIFNIEVFLDNFMTVYDENDINAILLLNNKEEEDPPVSIPSDKDTTEDNKPEEDEKPGNKEDKDTEEDTPDESGDNNENPDSDGESDNVDESGKEDEKNDDSTKDTSLPDDNTTPSEGSPVVTE